MVHPLSSIKKSHSFHGYILSSYSRALILTHNIDHIVNGNIITTSSGLKTSYDEVSLRQILFMQWPQKNVDYSHLTACLLYGLIPNLLFCVCTFQI